MPTATLPFYNAFRSLFYRGNVLLCPVCGHSFRKMMPGGNSRRPNARCPYCDSLERHRLLWLFIREKTNLLQSGGDLLHFAPEHCFDRVFRLNKKINYTSADLSSKLATVHTDITDLIFPDISFNYIICSHVLEHIADDTKALSELNRVLKKDGLVIIMTPVDMNRKVTMEDPPNSTPELRKKLFDAKDHVRIYGQDIIKRMENAGFHVKKHDYFASLPKDLQIKHALLGEEHIYTCTKK